MLLNCVRNSSAARTKIKMADTEVRIPRRKKGAKFHPKEAPFPVPIQSITRKEPCSDRWYYYTGYFRDNCVVIEDLGDLTFLYKMVSWLYHTFMESMGKMCTYQGKEDELTVELYF